MPRHATAAFFFTLAVVCILSVSGSFGTPAFSSDFPPEADLFEPDSPASSSTGKLPLLTILYDGMTNGELHPCPT